MEFTPKIEVIWMTDIEEEEPAVNTQWASEDFFDEEFVDVPEYIPSDSLSAISDPTTCKYCHKNFCTPKSLYKHCRIVHKIEPEMKRKPSRLCPLCQAESYDFNKFRTHVMTVHKIELQKLAMQFKNMKEFETWKCKEEQNQGCKFIQKRSAATRGGVIFRNFFCHRDGKPESKVPGEQRLRRLKAQGSCKMGGSCPAGVHTEETPAGVQLTYFPVHLAHEPDREKNFTPLTPEDKARLANAGLMRSWKRRNHEKYQTEPKIKKVKLVAKQLLDSPKPASEGEDNNGDAPHHDNEPATTMPLFDFTSPKRLFQSLVQPAEFKDFFESYWEQRPLVLHRHESLNHEQLSQLSQLFSKKTLLQLSKKHEMHFTKDLNALRYKDSKREDLNDVGRITVGKLNKLFDKDKATVQVHQPQRFQDSLWQVMEYLESFFGTLVGANVYITPGGSQGLSPHHDDVEVFILQLEGQKHWRLYKPIEELPRSYSIDLTQEMIGAPTHDLVLQPGDLLYFPRGTIHQADTPSGVSHSTHITFSTYQHHCWGDYMMSVFPHLLEEAMKTDVSFRRGLPINFIKSTKLSQTDKVQSVMGLLLQKLVHIKPPKFVAPENMIEDFMRSRLPPHLVDGRALRESLPGGKPPDLGCKVRLKHPDHVCFLVRKNAPDEEEGSEDEDEDDEEDEDEDESSEEGAGSSQLNQSGASSARFLSRSLMPSRDEEVLYVFSSLFNDRVGHMMDAGSTEEATGFALRFPAAYLESLNQLKASCDQFTAVSSLLLPGDAERENLIRALWSSHLLEVIPGAKAKVTRKSTKLD